jgi:hypothetical protein
MKKKLVRVTLLFRHSISNFYALSLENYCYGGAGGLLIADWYDPMRIMINETSNQSILSELEDPEIFVICYKQ